MTYNFQTATQRSTRVKLTNTQRSTAEATLKNARNLVTRLEAVVTSDSISSYGAESIAVDAWIIKTAIINLVTPTQPTQEGK